MTYVLENGIKWRAMPHDLPHWSTVYTYFRRWQREGVWERAAQALARLDREREGQVASPSAQRCFLRKARVMDSQSVKTTEKGAPWEGRAQEGEGQKTADPHGHWGRLLKVYVHPANRHNKWGGKALLETDLPPQVPTMAS